MNEPSLYDSAIPENDLETEPRPEPGTALTASVETIDNDRADLMFDAGVER